MKLKFSCKNYYSSKGENLNKMNIHSMKDIIYVTAWKD